MPGSRPYFSVSLMCMDLLRAGEQLDVLDERTDSYHIDVMDGHFAPNITLSPDFTAAVSARGGPPIEAHLMTEHPGDWIDPMAVAGATVVSVHAETITRDAFRVLDRIRDVGCRPGVVLNPATVIESVRHYLERVDVLTIMTVDVGYAGQRFIEEMLPKVSEAARLKEEHGLGYRLQIDGSCNASTFRRLWDAGAESFILGGSGLFDLDPDVGEAWRSMSESFGAATGATL